MNRVNQQKHSRMSLWWAALLWLWVPHAWAAPTLVDSLGEAQLAGIGLKNIASLSIAQGTLWITDESDHIYRWRQGERPVSFVASTTKRRFSSIIKVAEDKLLLADVREGQLLLGLDNQWQAFSSSGSDEGEIKRPVATAWSSHGIIYVAEAGNDRVSAFSDTGLFLFSFGDEAGKKDEANNLNQVLDIAVDRDGRVYVLDEEKGGRVSVYSAMGELRRQVVQEDLQGLLDVKVRLTAMTVRPDGVLLLADQKSGRIFEIDWESMEVVSAFGTAGRGRGQFQRVSSLALDDDGKLYVADRGNAKIEIFQLDWKQSPWIKRDADMMAIYPSSVLLSACDVSYLFAAEQLLCLDAKNDTVDLRSHDGVVLKAFAAKFDDPKRAAFNQQEIFILDDKNIKVFDAQGNWKFDFGGSGRREGEFSNASALSLTKTEVYIADTGNQRIQVFSRNGLFARVIGGNKDGLALKEPTSLAVDQRGNVYVADSELGKVLVYSAKGKLLRTLGAEKKQLHAFQRIHDVLIDREGVLYVMVSMENNPLSVWVYKDFELIYRFSPSTQTAKVGFDKQWQGQFKKQTNSSAEEIVTSAKNVMDSAVDLSLGSALNLFTGGSFFDENHWLFNPINSNQDAVALVNLSEHERHTLMILRTPKQVRDVLITGDKASLNLQWLPVGKDFSGYYTVYGRKDISSPFEVIQTTVEPNFSFPRQQLNVSEYRISAMSAFGKEGQLSAIYQDEFWVGYSAFQNQDFERALSVLEQAAQTNPQHAFVWLYLGQTQMAVAAYDEAIASFQRLAQLDESSMQAVHWQAKALMQKQAWLEVKILVDEAESNAHIDATLYGFAAAALSQLDDVPSAIYYLNQAVKLEPASSIWHLALADANFELGAKDNAALELLTATQLAGRNVQAWLGVARTYQKHGMVQDATASYQRALDIEPEQSAALSELAMLYLAHQKLDEARSLATKMVSIPALKATSYYVLGRVAMADNKAAKALTLLAKSGQMDAKNANVWLAMANAYAALGKGKHEKEYLAKAVALDDDNFDVHLRLGQSCAKQSDKDCAKVHFERAVSLDGRSAVARLALASALMKSGKMVEAGRHVQRVLQHDSASIDALLMLAATQSARGMIPDGIATLKKAMRIDAANMQVHLQLAQAYVANHMYDEATNIAEQAMLLDVRNASPLIVMGNIYVARQLFDDAIRTFTTAADLQPDNAKYRQYLNMAYLQKKKMVGAGGKMLGPKLSQLHFSRVFSAAYKQYADVPVGTLILRNKAGVDYNNVKISLFVKAYMDFPTTTVVEHVPANGEVSVSLLAAFNNRILDIDEDTGVQTEVKAEYYLAGKPHVETLNQNMNIYGKNAIVWDKLEMVGSFVTPKDDALAVFVRQLVNTYNPQQGAINARVSKAMTVYNGLSAFGIQYLVDPNTPYGNLDALQLDTVQFPRETLRQRSGDCDDLSILLAAALSNLGIETAILDVPAHLLMMFNTGVPASRKDSISLNDEAMAILDGQVWIPLEATLIGASFTEAWAEGARKYHLYGKQAKMKIMPLASAWENYKPVTLPPADFALDIPDKGMMGDKIDKEWSILLVRALERQVRPYRVMLALDPNNIQAQMQIAVVYARNGLYDEASVALTRIHAADPQNAAALNNLGNIYYMQQSYQKALAMYQKALGIEANNADIMVNIAMVNYKVGDSRAAETVFAQATTQDDQVPVRYAQLALLLMQ